MTSKMGKDLRWGFPTSGPPGAVGEPHREVRNEVLGVHSPPPTHTQPGPGAPKLLAIQALLGLGELRAELGLKDVN